MLSATIIDHHERPSPQPNQPDHWNRRLFHHRVAADLHQQALERLIAGDNWGAVRIWKRTLTCLSSASNPCESDAGTTILNDSEAASYAFCQDDPSEEPPGFSTGYFETLTLPLPTGCPEPTLPQTVFSLNEAVMEDGVLAVDWMNDALAVLVFYHIAVSIHRAGVSCEFQFQLNQSLEFYELAHKILTHTESLWCTRMGNLVTIITEQIVSLYRLSGTAPSA
jgi:hypothetical protein